MKTNTLIPIIIFIGLLTLFLFPNPEENFPSYVGMGLFFIILIVFLLIKSKKNKINN